MVYSHKNQITMKITQEEFNKMLRKAVDEGVIYIGNKRIYSYTYEDVTYRYILTHN